MKISLDIKIIKYQLIHLYKLSSEMLQYSISGALKTNLKNLPHSN